MLTEQERANIGPRDLKEEGSPEWCWQTAGLLQDLWESVNAAVGRYDEAWESLVEHHAWERIPQGAPFGSLEAMKEGLKLGSQCLGTCLCEPGAHQDGKPGTDSRSAQPGGDRDALGRKHPHFRLVPETGWPAVEGIWPAGPRVEGLGGLGLSLTRIPASVIHR